MAQLVRDVMTSDLVSLPRDASATEAARQMRDHDTGAILVVGDRDDLAGILTDRDTVVRAVAEGIDPDDCRIGDICTPDPEALSPTTRSRTRSDPARAQGQARPRDRGRQARGHRVHR